MTIEIREYRTEGHRLLFTSDYSPSEIARLAGLDRRRVSEWRAGKCRPTEDDRRALEKAVGIPPRSWDAAPVVQAPDRPAVAAPAGAPQATATTAIAADALGTPELEALGLAGLERLIAQVEALEPTLAAQHRLRALETRARIVAVHEQLSQKKADAAQTYFASRAFAEEVRMLAAAFPDAPAFRERLRHLGVELPAPPAPGVAVPDAPTTMEDLDELEAELGTAAAYRDAGEPLMAMAHCLSLGLDVHAEALGALLAAHPDRAPRVLALLDPVDGARVRGAMTQTMAVADACKLDASARTVLAELLRQLGHADVAADVVVGGGTDA
jgi:transcriptional regulator with XRE-family HTH domain